MMKDIEIIINKNRNLFGDNPILEKSNVGFTNNIFVINDKYIIKICTDKENESEFKNEIDFYKANKENEFIPEMYYYDIDKKDIQYCYEILEKIPGVSLYNVWYTFDENQREDIIRQLCEIMKVFHSNKGESYGWYKKIDDEFINLYDKAKSLNLFDEKEQEDISKAHLKFKDYLDSDEFVFVHNDLHFDNIIYNNGKIKVIDFERSLYAPKDFELDILYRMIRKPWKFASEETEQYTNADDYKNIMKYIEKYYPELINTNNLYKKLAIYDIVYFLKHYINNPSITELKEDILDAVNDII